MNCTFEMGPIRPPNEGRDCSLLIRATRNCPWNRCLFCPVYKKGKFKLRSCADIKQDINVAKWLHDKIETIVVGNSPNFGEIDGLIRDILDHHGDGVSEWSLRNNVNNILSWLASGAKTVFLQDADIMVMRTSDIIEIIRHLKATFATLERCSAYARARTFRKKTIQELEDLHEAGLSRLHLGLESGNDLVLEFMQKGITHEQQIAAGKKIVKSGISLSEYVMPGLGGRHWSEVHAIDSAKALSEINPDFIRMRSLVIKTNSPLYQPYKDGVFEELSEDEVVSEIALFVNNLDCNSYIISDHAANLLPEVEGQLPGDKDRILSEIGKYLNKPLMERLNFRLKRRLITYRYICGAINRGLSEKVSQAFEEINKESPVAYSKTEEAISALKRGYI